MKLIMPLGIVPVIVLSVLIPCTMAVLFDKNLAVLVLAELASASVLLFAYKTVLDTFEYLSEHGIAPGAMWI